MNKNDKIIKRITNKQLPLSSEDLQITVDFCQEQIMAKNLRVLGQLPTILYQDWVDENLPIEIRADGHFHVRPAEWRAELEGQCYLATSSCLRDNSYGPSENIAALLVWRAALAFLPALVCHGVKTYHMQMRRTKELGITISLPLGKGEGVIGKCDKVYVPDPMIAAGTSCAAAIDILNSLGVPNEKITLLCVCAAPEGTCRLLRCYPGIKIVAASLSERLNKDAYIIGTGLGDAGEKYFRGNSINSFEKYRRFFNQSQWSRLEHLLEVANKRGR